MRMRQYLAILGSVVAVATVAAVLWPKAEDTLAPSPLGNEAPPASFEPVRVEANEQGGLTLTGRVLDPTGEGVAGAEVFLAASAQSSLGTVKCEECGELLLACPSRETGLRVAEHLAQGRGALHPALTTRTDETGAFRFEHLAGVSFTVWARVAHLGEGTRERAAPGEPVELFLPPLRTLTGTVQDDQGRPVAHATVYAVSPRLPLIHQATSDARGAFEVKDLGEGPFYVLAQASGWLPAFAEEVEAGPQPLRLTLLTPRRLEVAVTSGGAPVEARVTLVADHLSRTSTAAKGLAVFEGLYPVELVITAVHQNLSAAPHVVTLDAPVTQVRLELERGGTLAVTVVDEGGQPVPEPELSLTTPTNELIAKKKARTGELVSFGPFAAGDYLLTGTAEGFRPQSVPAVLKEGETTLELAMTRGTVISGRVLDEYGRPAPGISILVGPTGDSVLADAEGRFVAQVPSPGLYELHAHHSDWGGGLVRVTAPAQGVELHLEPRAGVQVTVLAQGRRVEGAHVVLFIERQGSFRSDRPSGPDGLVQVRGMPAGQYTMVAMHPEYLPSDRQEVRMADGELLHLVAELRPGASITGEVVDRQGAPVSGVSVSIVPRAAEPAVSDGVGRFELRALRPGMTYRLEAKHPSFEQLERVLATAGGERVKVVLERKKVFRGRVLSEEGGPLRRFRIDEHQVDSADGRFELPLPSVDDRVIFAVDAPGHEPLMVDRPATPDVGDLVLRRAPEFTGTVRDEGGGPVSDAVVTCDVCDQSVLSASDGRFQLTSPPFATQYTVSARKGRLSGSTQVIGSLGAIEVVLQPAVRLFGVAYLADGRPAAGVEIEGIHLDRSEPVTVVTGPDGSYSIEVSPGSYRFAQGGGDTPVDHFSQPALLVQVSASQTRLDFGPAPGTASLSVRVTPQRGYALWVVRQDLPTVGDPPIELLRAPYAVLHYQPVREAVTVTGLAPGRYTVVWGSFHVETPGGPHLQRVDVPQTREVSFVR
ncbi:MAG: carboxypeptidase regulatory-like domain-containing protein [Myxococcota bacterium]